MPLFIYQEIDKFECWKGWYMNDTTFPFLSEEVIYITFVPSLNPFASGIPKVLLSPITGLFSVKIR